jgi:deoxyadenosine/deoxycytidine kinase
LLSQFNGYVEAADDNPHLLSILKGKPDFDAFANQQWFLNRIREFLHNANPRRPVILDQDPAAIVMVYSRMFRDEGLIGDSGYRALFTDLLDLEKDMSRWKSPRTIFYLDAPAEVLRQRVVQRSGNAATPSLKWFTTVRSYFHELSTELPNVTRFSTDGITPQEISNQVAEVLGN